MVSSSFNIQYQSTGVGSLSLLDEVKPRQSVWGLFYCIEFDIIVVQKTNFVVVFFSLYDRYPQRNSTVDSTATVVAVAVAMMEEEAFMVGCCL